MQDIPYETLQVLRKAVAHYLDVLDDDNNKDEHEYKLLNNLYNVLVDLTFNK